MEIITSPTAKEASRLAARYVARLVQQKPHAVLGLATGGTPVMLYQELITLHQEGLDFSQVTTFNLDEYIGLAPDHPCSYRRFMNENLFDHLNIPAECTHLPDGLANDVEAHCQEYEDAIAAAGGLDVQILGVGTDGHIGFNEPTSSLASRTRIKTLTEQTRTDNARFFEHPEQVPIHCVTMGIGTIMDSRRIIMLAFGKQKAEIVKAFVEGPVTAMVPASVLQMHPHVTVFLDDAAASLLSKRDYYDWVYRNKPQWQTIEGKSASTASS